MQTALLQEAEDMLATEECSGHLECYYTWCQFLIPGARVERWERPGLEALLHDGQAPRVT